MSATPQVGWSRADRNAPRLTAVNVDGSPSIHAYRTLDEQPGKPRTRLTGGRSGPGADPAQGIR